MLEADIDIRVKAKNKKRVQNQYPEASENASSLIGTLKDFERTFIASANISKSKSSEVTYKRNLLRFRKLGQLIIVFVVSEVKKNFVDEIHLQQTYV